VLCLNLTYSLEITITLLFKWVNYKTYILHMAEFAFK
jgi:hypothetical protein